MTPRRQAYKREITLLSHGYTNPKAWPDGKLTVYPWDNAIDQWLLDNLKKLTKPDLVYGLLRNCCDLRGGDTAKVEDIIGKFVADEINVVLLVSRALTTDGVVSYTAVCPHCGAKKAEKIKVPDELEKVGEKTMDYAGSDSVTLPDVADIVALRPLTVDDEKVIASRTEELRRATPDGELRTVMRVVTINETKPDTLAELILWFRALSPKDAKFLEEQGRLITPHLNTMVPHICDEPECGKKFNFPLNFDQDFFR
jgi:hypothetical protein